jgi:AcrR family transcriptional regulator
MARPRVHDIDMLLDAAEELLADGGAQAVTVRALAERTGASSGSLYHAFGSRNALLGHLWLRAARRFLALQRDAVDRHLGNPELDAREAAIEATVAAASTPALLARTAPNSATVLLEQRRDAVLAEGGLPDELSTDLRALDRELVAVMRTLADALYGRHNRQAVDTVAVCIVDLPSALLNSRHERKIDALAALDAAVRGVIAAG